MFERDSYRCRYCRRAPAKQLDHLIPYALRRLHRLPDDDPDFLVASCVSCNLRKGTFHVVPLNMAHLIPDLPGKDWRTWDGLSAP